MLPPRFPSLCLLVAEDEPMIAMMIEELLLEEGCKVLGPYARLTELSEAASLQKFDGALLDINLHGQRSFPVAEMLAARDVPFILLTGYDGTVVPDDHPEWVICSKPFAPETLIAMVERHILRTSSLDGGPASSEQGV